MVPTAPGQAIVPVPPISEPVIAEQRLALDVSINGFAIDKIGAFVLRDGILRARRAEWRELGIIVPSPVGSSPDDLLGPADLPGVRWVFDPDQQTLAITAPTARLVATELSDARVEDDSTLQSATGFTLNYDIDATAAGASRQASGLFDARFFSSVGVVSSAMLAVIIRGRGTTPRSSAIRLDTAYSYSDRNALRRYRLGDFITGSLSWTRPVRMGGGQITADFSTRPDLITFPLPSLRGSAAVPSTVDILENGTRLFSRDVAAGPFEVSQLPVITGAGTLSVRVRDALGRQVTVNQSFYASATLLSPGLQSFSLQAGAVRTDWGVKSNAYAGIAASATWRRGLSAIATVEASAEATHGAALGGGGLILDLGHVAILNVAAAASTGDGGTGAKVSAGLQRVGTVFSLAAAATFATRRFRDIAAVYGDPVAQLQINASTGLTVATLGSLGLAFVAVNRDAYNGLTQACGIGAMETDCGDYAIPAQRTRIISASYSRQIGRFALYATAYGDIRNQSARGVVVGLTLPLGGRRSASVSAGGGGGSHYAQLDVAQSAATIGNWGYRGYAAIGTTPHQFAQVQYKAPWALLSAGLDHVSGLTTLRGEAQGSLSIVAGGLFAANAINDSFAVVDTDSLPNIRVFHENRAIGRTNARGLLLVPELRAFDLNHIGIEATDIPPDITIATDAQGVRPQDRSGVIVKFFAQASNGALLLLVDAAGAPLPIGSVVTVRQTQLVAPVGYDGKSYVTGLAPLNILDVVTPDGMRCSVSVAYRAKAGDIPSLSPLMCKVQAQ